MTSPLLRIRAGIEAGNANEVVAGVKQADTTNVTLASNVRDMITQWLKVNAPEKLPEIGLAAPADAPVPASEPKVDAGSLKSTPPAKAPADEEGVRAGEGTRGWSSAAPAGDRAPVGKAANPNSRGTPSPERLRICLIKFFEGAPKGSDAAAGLGIVEDESDNTRYLPFAMLGRGVGLSEDEDIVRIVQRSIVQAQPGIFSIAPDGSGAGLIEWVGWEEFSSSLASIAASTRDPAFEPKSIQGLIARAARGAVRAGQVRQEDALRSMQESLSPQDMPEDAAPALRSAISRRARLALACLVDGLAAAGLAPEAGPDAMGLVGQLPRTLFGLIFDHIDDRDRGACAFLAEILQSWDRRRCFSKRWLQDAASKFTAPKGANSERDEGKGWYALTADNARRDKASAGQPASDTVEGNAVKEGAPAQDGAEGEAAAGSDKHRANKKRGIVQDEEDDATVNKTLEESRKRRAALKAKYGDR